MRVIPLQDTPSQQVAVTLGTQSCLISVYQKSTGLYLDLVASGSAVVSGVIAQDRNRLVRDAYLGFDGDLAFYDTEGAEDPDYSGLGARWFLGWLEPGEVSG